MSWHEAYTINIFLHQCEWFMVSGEQCFGNYNSKVINPWITIKMNYCCFKKNTTTITIHKCIFLKYEYTSKG